MRGLFKWAACGCATAVVGPVVTLWATLNAMHNSVGLRPPTEGMMAIEDPKQHALFRALPELQKKVAWKSLGDFPTPIHKGQVSTPGSGQRVQFYVKREDLASPRCTCTL